MELYSTNHQSPNVDLRTAVLEGMPGDGGLYMPVEIPSLPDPFIRALPNLSFQQIAFEVAQSFFSDEIATSDLREIVESAINFDAPLVPVTVRIASLELFHGPTLAFKDFGARFMARLMSHFIRDESGELTILVATSGDTGSAVAHGFLGVPGIRVFILYPSGKVSTIQEKQFTTLGGNITALEVDGNFDDCQRLVKAAFVDDKLNTTLNLTSANSINISRLIPQSFYYFYGFGSFQHQGHPTVISVPSGNYGNLTAGLIARRMGLPVAKFIAASNVNDVVPKFLSTGEFSPRPSIQTVSNAMDVGDPSNFARMLEIYENDQEKMLQDVHGDSYTDEQTEKAISRVYEESGYLLDPHGAVGFLALDSFLKDSPAARGFFLETAHPAKFLETVQPLIDAEVPMPKRLEQALNKPKQSRLLAAEFSDLQEFLLSTT